MLWSFIAATFISMDETKIMQDGTGNDDLGRQSHVFQPQARLQAVKSVFENTEGLFNKTSGLTVGYVEPALTEVMRITQEGGNQPRPETIGTVTKKNSVWKRKLSSCFKHLPQGAVLKHSAVVVSAPVTRVDVKYLPLRSGNAQHIDRMRVVAVQEGGFIC